MHSIQLRDPWQSESTESGIRWLRSFHRPTGLTERETVWLVVSLPSVVVSLNGKLLSASGDDTTVRFCVTSLLADRNRVAIIVAGEKATADERAFEVWLEIDGP